MRRHKSVYLPAITFAFTMEWNLLGDDRMLIRNVNLPTSIKLKKDNLSLNKQFSFVANTLSA